MHRKVMLAGAVCVGCATPLTIGATELLAAQISFQTHGQNLWGTGSAFVFDYNKFLGVKEVGFTQVVNPAEVAGSVDLPFPIPNFDYSVDPYFSFTGKLTAGINVGAHVAGGSIDANLDYGVSLAAPDRIVRGQAFSLQGSATPLASSNFRTSAPTAEAYIDGTLAAYFGAYMRFVTTQDLGDHDYRMGNRGYTDQNSNNKPHFSVVDTGVTQEVVSFNRGGNGQLRLFGVNPKAIGADPSTYDVGPYTVTFGDWRVNPGASLANGKLRGSDQATFLTARLDVDAAIAPGVFGNGVAHDWGVVRFDMGYDLLDFGTSLSLGLKQNLGIDSNVRLRLSFSDAVLIDGAAGTEWTGAIDALPQIALLGDSVTVTPQFLVAATLDNQTDLTFAAGADFTALDAHMFAAYDTTFYGKGASGTIVNEGLGPFYTWNTTLPLGDIGVYDDSFALQGFQTITGQSFVLSAVPEPAALPLWAAGLVGVAGYAGRRRRLSSGHRRARGALSRPQEEGRGASPLPRWPDACPYQLSNRTADSIRS